MEALAILHERLCAAHRGKPQVVLLSGPPGTGKSSLTRLFINGCGPSIRVLFASAHHSVNYDDTVLEQLGFPTADLVSAPNTAGPWLLSRLWDAPETTLLCLDNLEAIDVISAHALAFALTRLGSAPVISVLAMRPEGLDELQMGLVRRATEETGLIIDLRSDADAAPTELRDHPPEADDHRPASAWMTARERLIAELAAEGLRNREIADTLMISTRTVETHLYRIYAKLGVSNRTQLSRQLLNP